MGEVIVGVLYGLFVGFYLGVGVAWIRLTRPRTVHRPHIEQRDTGGRKIDVRGSKNVAEEFRRLTELGGMADYWPDGRQYLEDGRRRDA